jgi:hypothetical protein
MFTHSTLFLATAAALLGLAALAAPAADPDRQMALGSARATCDALEGAFPVRDDDRRPDGRLVFPGTEDDRQGVDGGLDLSTVIAQSPDLGMAGVVGALAQMIVEAELGNAALTGHFRSSIAASVAGSDFDLEVCRDSIVGQVSVAHGSPVRFVVGDFDRDGITDVAVRRPGSATWSLDLGARHRGLGRFGAVPAPILIEAAGPGAETLPGTARCMVAWLAAAGAVGGSG